MQYYKLVDLCTDIIDCPHSTPKWRKDGVRIIRNFNLQNGLIDFSDGYYVDQDTYLQRIRRANPEENDIIISREAPMGVVGIVPKRLKCCLGQRLVLLKVNKRKVNPTYLLFILMSDFVQKQFKRADATGSIVSNLCIPDLKNIIIPIIDGRQENIARFLSNINRKIILNKTLNDNLREQLKVLYNYWFTQFNFLDNNGKPYKNSGGLLKTVEGLSYKIPEHWVVQNLFENSLSSNIRTGVNPFTTKKYLATADVNGVDMQDGKAINYETRENRANMQPSLYSVWFAKMKNSIKHMYLNEPMQGMINNTILSTGFCGLQCSEESFEYVASFIEYSYFETLKDTLAHGATQEAVNNEDIIKIPFVIPDSRVLSEYHNRTKAIYTQISKNICENMTLVKIRDWLLPMLMNGQATIID